MSSYAKKNQLTNEITSTDLVVGGLILSAVAAIVYVGYLGNKASATAAPAAPAPSPAQAPTTTTASPGATPPAAAPAPAPASPSSTSSPPASPLPTSGGVTWQPVGTSKQAVLGQAVAASATDSSGNQYVVTGHATGIKANAVTFTPKTVTAKLPATKPITLPSGYVMPL